eukprot:CAMPEP_0115765494 /NCGR_PEP_ID=MMETSP0272-20121206/102627_1 /TAXON_ID=71861 /ORGANISM="Scrippsiella trochoidea, Strain CCMP3099" /LENGTH=97 /DNA_ID=CAMNT_0003211359 /DNA_START=233 /DNA_END=526 /DNA_ORIENTATION=-
MVTTNITIAPVITVCAMRNELVPGMTYRPAMYIRPQATPQRPVTSEMTPNQESDSTDSLITKLLSESIGNQPQALPTKKKATPTLWFCLWPQTHAAR